MIASCLPPETLEPTELESEPTPGGGPASLKVSPDAEEPGMQALLQDVGDQDLLRLIPSLAKPQKVLLAARQADLLAPFIHQLLLQEEIKRSGGQLADLNVWRRERWGPRVEQAFIDQRRRFERASYFQLMLPERGEAMELYLQLCNAEVSFDDLLRRYAPTKPGKPQRGLVREQPLLELPKLLAKKLRKSRPGVPLAPLAVGRGYALLQLIAWHAPVLDEPTRALLEQEVEDQWLRQELQRRLQTLPVSSTPTALAALSA